MTLTPDEAEWLRVQIGPHELLIAQATASNLVSGASDPACRGADVCLGQPAVEDVLGSSTLRWIHLTSAGYTRYDREDVKASLTARDAVLTNSSGVYDDPCAQQVLAFMLEQSRFLHGCLRLQDEQDWAYVEMRRRQRVLTGQSAVVVGYGAIGRRLVELLSPFRMDLKAVRRTVSGQEEIPTFPVSELEEHLGDADHVINLLPANTSTERIFNGSAFGRIKKGATFYNVGRGDTVEQHALVEALKIGQVGAAYLDVTSPEPLPKGDPLWTAPNVYITPHVAGGVQDESQRLLDHFLGNLKRFGAGVNLMDRII